MNLNIKIDKNGNLVDIDNGTVLIPSSSLFPTSMFSTETVDNYLKINSQSSYSLTSISLSSFNNGDTITFYFKIYLPVVGYYEKSFIFEFDINDSDNTDVGFYKKSGYPTWSVELNSIEETSLDRTSPHLIQGYYRFTKESNTITVFVVINEIVNSAENFIIATSDNFSNITTNYLGIGVGADLHYGSGNLLANTRFYDDVPYANNPPTPITPVSGDHKYLDYTGLQTLVTDIINYHTAHTVDAYSKTEIDNMLLNYYRNDGFGISSFGLSYFGGRG